MTRYFACILAMASFGLLTGSAAQNAYALPYGQFLATMMEARDAARAEATAAFMSAPLPAEKQQDTREHDRRPLKCIGLRGIYIGSACDARL